MIAYRATLDVPRELAWFTAKLLAALLQGEEDRTRRCMRTARAWACSSAPGTRTRPEPVKRLAVGPQTVYSFTNRIFCAWFRSC